MPGFANSVEVLFAHYNEPLPDSFEYPIMPEELTARQARKWKSRRVAHFLLNLLFKKYQLDLTYLQNIKTKDNGRPYLEIPYFDYNISHSGEWVAIIFSSSSAEHKISVGIDIEHPLKPRDYISLIKHYANIEEQTCLLADNCPILTNLTDRFYLSWCLREAVLKVSGVGIAKLSSVKHFPLERQIITEHCPNGQLYFHYTLPFYLCYFYQQDMLSLAPDLKPSINQWHNGTLIPIESPALVYRVNVRNEIK